MVIGGGVAGSLIAKSLQFHSDLTLIDQYVFIYCIIYIIYYISSLSLLIPMCELVSPCSYFIYVNSIFAGKLANMDN